MRHKADQALWRRWPAGVLARQWLGEPLVQFAFLAGLIFAAYALWAGARAQADRTIYVSPEDMVFLQAQGFSETGEKPSAETLERLLADHVRKEVLYREARRLNLDEADAVVRGRLIDKMRFLIEDGAPPEPPTEAELQAAYAADPEKYRVPARISFQQIAYIATGEGDAVDLRPDRDLGSLNGANPPDWMELGDTFLLPGTLEEMSKEDVSRLFGSVFAERLMALTPGEWAGPIPSKEGTHLVRLDRIMPEVAATYTEARDLVSADLVDSRWRATNEAALAKLIEQYTVVIASPET